MSTVRVRLDPTVPGLESLGFADADEVLTRETFARGRVEPLAAPLARMGRTRLRLPLPGTPERSVGPLAGRPGGAGTGWIVVDRWRDVSWRCALGTRFVAPRSASPAERAWNLYCHLRAHGIGTPEPLAVGARGAGLVAPSSFLVTRELVGFVPAETWLANAVERETRERGIEALGRAFARLRTARVFLPRIEPAHVVLSLAELGAGACESEDAARPAGMTLRRLPSVAITEVAGGSVRARLGDRELALMLVRCLGGARGATRREVARFLALALEGLGPARARAVRRRAFGNER